MIDQCEDVTVGRVLRALRELGVFGSREVALEAVKQAPSIAACNGAWRPASFRQPHVPDEAALLVTEEAERFGDRHTKDKVRERCRMDIPG